MSDVLTLIQFSDDQMENETTREVFCGVRSVGHTEYYEANAIDYHPELKFVLADYLDYQGETLCEYEGTRYRVLRTYRTGQELELTVTRASAEEGEAYG